MDMLDDLISVERIYPQLAMKILANFDQAITEALQKSVRARLTFKVSVSLGNARPRESDPKHIFIFISFPSLLRRRIKHLACCEGA